MDFKTTMIHRTRLYASRHTSKAHLPRQVIFMMLTFWGAFFNLNSSPTTPNTNDVPHSSLWIQKPEELRPLNQEFINSEPFNPNTYTVKCLTPSDPLADQKSEERWCKWITLGVGVLALTSAGVALYMTHHLWWPFNSDESGLTSINGTVPPWMPDAGSNNTHSLQEEGFYDTQEPLNNVSNSMPSSPAPFSLFDFSTQSMQNISTSMADRLSEVSIFETTTTPTPSILETTPTPSSLPSTLNKTLGFFKSQCRRLFYETSSWTDLGNISLSYTKEFNKGTAAAEVFLTGRREACGITLHSDNTSDTYPRAINSEGQIVNDTFIEPLTHVLQTTVGGS